MAKKQEAGFITYSVDGIEYEDYDANRTHKRAEFKRVAPRATRKKVFGRWRTRYTFGWHADDRVEVE